MTKPLPLWSRILEANSNSNPEVESPLSAAAGIALTLAEKKMRSQNFWTLIPVFLVVSCTESDRRQHPSDIAKHPRIHQCAKCESTKVFFDEGGPFPSGISPDTRDYKSPTFDECAHVWHESVSKAAPASIKNGKVILLKQGDAYAAILPTEQSGESWNFTVSYPGRPEQNVGNRHIPEIKPRDEKTGASVEWIVYRWVYRKDGSGLLDQSSPLVKSGVTVSTGASGDGVIVQDIQIDWSLLWGEEEGFLYYPRFPGEPMLPEEPQFCITSLSSFEKLDAADTKWTYKGAISDISD